MIVSLDENQSIIMLKYDDAVDRVVITVNNNFRSDYPEEKVNRINEVLAFLYDEFSYNLDRQQILTFEPDDELLERVEKRRKEEEKKCNIIHLSKRDH